MKSQRRSRRHFKLKAAAGAYSDRYGLRLLQLPNPTGKTEPWVKDFPVCGTATVILPPIPAFARRP